ncbi:MAG: RNA methyltransferase [Acidimicrobiales bacterium]|nr:RNA methyltransferase [Acidimicrobiales bacterium]
MLRTVATLIPVDDPGDPRLADYRHLRDAELRRSVEGGEGRGIFVAEGVAVLRRLLASPYPVRSLLVLPARAAALGDVLEGVAAPVYVASRQILGAVAGFDLHRGALAAADRLPLPDPAAVVARAGRLLLLEGIGDHENLGALFRSAAALGADGVLLDPRSCDPLYRRSVRVSMGAVLHVPWTRLAPWPGRLAWLRAAGFTVLALTPAPDAEPIDRLDPPPSGPLAILLGAEGPGLSLAALAAADRRVRIPMSGRADSLNVAAAGAVALWALRPG